MITTVGTTIRERYARQLETLREDLLRLGNMAQHSLDKAIKSLETWDVTAAEQVIRDDMYIDEARRQVEEKAILLIATQQPVASDLRLVGSVFAIATELERIGDYAKHIARRLRRTSKRPILVTPPPALNEMAKLALDMLSNCLEAFVNQDIGIARSLTEQDTRLDEMEKALRTELIEQARNDPQRLESILDLIDVVHALERLGDRTTNIGERVIYVETNVLPDLNP